MRQIVLTWRSILGLELLLSVTAVTRTKSEHGRQFVDETRSCFRITARVAKHRANLADGFLDGLAEFCLRLW